MDGASPPPNPPPRLTRRKVLAALAAAALGAIGAAIGWRIWLKPQNRLAELRAQTMRDVAVLYGLQLSYKKARGTYANDLDALLTLAPDRAALKARLAAHVDMNTFVVGGNAEKFRIEANLLDRDRTLIKLRGPIRTQAPAR